MSLNPTANITPDSEKTYAFDTGALSQMKSRQIDSDDNFNQSRLSQIIEKASTQEKNDQLTLQNALRFLDSISQCKQMLPLSESSVFKLSKLL